VGWVPAQRSRARGLALLVEDSRRQYNAGVPIARTAFDRRNTAMMRLLRRHLGVHLMNIGSSRQFQSPPLLAHQ
jgi:hypothetical protein